MVGDHSAARLGQAPSQAPTLTPTELPTQAPSQAPTQAPTQVPTVVPTQAPTLMPTELPTGVSATAGLGGRVELETWEEREVWSEEGRAGMRGSTECEV